MQCAWKEPHYEVTTEVSSVAWANRLEGKCADGAMPGVGEPAKVHQLNVAMREDEDKAEDLPRAGRSSFAAHRFDNLDPA
jgi:hypothetical protein